MKNDNVDNLDSQLDIQYSQTVDKELLSSFAAEIDRRLSGSVTTHPVHQRSHEIPMWISIVVASVAALSHVLGVSAYFKARMQERGRIDARQAHARRQQRVQSSNWFVNQLADFKTRGASVTIAIRIPPAKFSNKMVADHFGGLRLKGTTPEIISAQLDQLMQHIPALEHLIDTEITPNPVLGGVNLRLVPDGLEVSWISQESLDKHVRLLKSPPSGIE